MNAIEEKPGEFAAVAFLMDHYGVAGQYVSPDVVYVEGAALTCDENYGYIRYDGRCIWGQLRGSPAEPVVEMAWYADQAKHSDGFAGRESTFAHEMCHHAFWDPEHRGPCALNSPVVRAADEALRAAGL